MDSLRQSFHTPLTSRSPATLTNDDIEAVIQMATSSRQTPDGRFAPLKDTRTQLFVGNLPYRVRWQDLKDLFRRAGTVLRADVSLGPDNRSRGYGTVLLATAEDAGRAIDIFNGYSWQTRILEVRPDRLPPDFDASVAPGFSSPSGSLSTQPSSSSTPFPEEYDLSALLDLQHNFPNVPTGPCRNLFVGNLPFHCQWQDLKDLFRQAGTILRADVALGQDGRSRGFGTVVFATETDAERAVKMFNGYEYNGRVLKVNFDKFTQVGQQNTLLPNAGGTSVGVGMPLSPASLPSSLTSLAELNLASPSLSRARQPPTHVQSGKLSLPPGHHLYTAPYDTSDPPSPFDLWDLKRNREKDERERLKEREKEREALRAFQRREAQSRTSTTPSHLHPTPAASRSASDSSTKPPSLATAASSSSDVSTFSSTAASTTSTSDQSNGFSLPKEQHHERPSSTSHARSVPTSPPSLLQSRQHHSNGSSSSHHSHPHHPGPIALPPPPHVTSFPLHAHGMSPHGVMGISLSPLHHPMGSPTSPFFHPHHQLHMQQQQQKFNAQMQQHPVPITPHGLPPITPSMPPFNFLPPLSPIAATTNIPSQPPYPNYSQHPLPSPTMTLTGPMTMSMPMHMRMPQSPLHGTHPPFPHEPLQQQQNQAYDQQIRHRQQPQSSFTLGGINAFNLSKPPAGHSADNGSGGASTFSPGIAMSPGAFWGRPGAGGANPMINPAVGAPVHMQHVGSPMHSPGHGGLFYHAPGGVMHEPSGYFDSAYFPPMGAAGGNGGGFSGVGLSSGLANEILKGHGGQGAWEDSGGGGGETEASEGGMEVPDAGSVQGKRKGGDVVDESPFEEAEGEQKPIVERVRRHSSTEATAWQTTKEGDSRVWEGRESKERGGEVSGRPEMKSEIVQVVPAEGLLISRTHSMTGSKKPSNLASIRSESDPLPNEHHDDYRGVVNDPHRAEREGNGY